MQSLKMAKKNLEEAHARVGGLETMLEDMKSSKENEEQKGKTLELALKDKEDAREQTNPANSNGKDEKTDASVEPELSNNTRNQGIFCNFYNNYESCDFERITGKKCHFIHKESPRCRFGIVCNRHKCMFRHLDVSPWQPSPPSPPPPLLPFWIPTPPQAWFPQQLWQNGKSRQN